jgi:hypothetical protein
MFVLRLQVADHSIDELLCLAAAPERAIGKLEFLDCLIQKFNGIAWVERGTEIPLLNAAWIAEVFCQLERIC